MLDSLINTLSAASENSFEGVFARHFDHVSQLKIASLTEGSNELSYLFDLAKEIKSAVLKDKDLSALAQSNSQEVEMNLGRIIGSAVGDKINAISTNREKTLAEIVSEIEGSSSDRSARRSFISSVFDKAKSEAREQLILKEPPKRAPKPKTSPIENANMLGRVGEFMTKASELRGKDAYAAGIYAALTGLSGYLTLNHLSKTTAKDPTTGERHTQWNQLTWAGVNAAIAGLMAISLHTVVKGRG